MSEAEARALYALLDQLTGSNPESLFAWDGTDDGADPLTAALAKVFGAAGAKVPGGLQG